MAKNVGQFRRFDYEDEIFVNGYMSTVITHLSVPAGSSKFYYDTALNITNGALSSTKCYFLKVTFKPLPGGLEQAINIKLKMRGDDTGKMFQNIKTVYVTTKPITSTVIFMPNAEYDQIVFELSRNPNADNSAITGPTSDKFPHGIGRVVEIATKDNGTIDGEFFGVKNMIDELKSIYPSLHTISQIGIRTQSNVPICINGEEIYANPTGTYELHNGIDIDYLGFVLGANRLSPDQKSNFIVDFIY